jgi:hypothetical protein
MTKTILIYGHEGTLVGTRRQVLASHSILSATTTDRSQVERFLCRISTDLLVLCSSLGADEQEKVAQFAHTHAPGSKCLVILKPGGRIPQLYPDNMQFEALLGPEKFVQEVERLLS